MRKNYHLICKIIIIRRNRKFRGFSPGNWFRKFLHGIFKKLSGKTTEILWLYEGAG